MENFDIKGNVKVYKNGELVWENHNTILYAGRNAVAQILSGATVASNIAWKLRLGWGWQGYLGEADPSITLLYNDASTDPEGGSNSLFERMGGNIANYPIPTNTTGGVVLSSSIQDERVVATARQNRITFSFNITGLTGDNLYPINEFGLCLNYVDGTSANNEVIFAYEPITNIILEASSVMSVVWELTF